MGAPATVAALVEGRCAARPSAVAVESPDGATATYADLRDRIDRIAAALGPPPAGPPTGPAAPAPPRAHAAVAVDLPNGLDFCAAVVAVLARGTTLFAVDRTQPRARLAAMLATVAPEIVITDRPGGTAAGLASGARVVDVAAITDRPPGLPPGPVPGPPGPGGDAPAYVIFTSGSTGVPKATLNTHAGLLNHLVFMGDACALPEGGRVLLKSARSFDAWLLEFFWALAHGHTLVLADEERATDARYLADVLATRSIHGFVCVPSLLRRVFSVLERTAAGTDLRVVVSAGEPLRADLATTVLTSTDARLFNFYGPAEAAIDVAFHPVTGPPVHDPVPVGRPIPGNRLTVRSAGGHDVTGTGEVGELVVAGVHVGLGYAGDEAATSAAFGSDGGAGNGGGARTYATGDLAFLGPDKNFYLGGRMDTQVKINGVRIETAEIEACLLRHKTVADCTVQVTTSGDVPVLVAFVKPDGDAEPPSEYINYLREKLPPVMVPPSYVFLNDFEYLPSGKKDTSKLVFPRGLPTVTAAEFEAPADGTERALADIWEAVLGVAPVGATDEFALIGGDSLKLIDTLVKVSESVYPDVFALGITRLSTVRDLARKIEQAQGR